MWDLLEAKPLCDGHDSRFDEYTCRAHLAQLVGLFGPPPLELLQRGTETAHYFNPDGINILGSLLHIELIDHIVYTGTFQNPELIPTGYALEDSVKSLKGEEKRLFLEFAKKMLCWLPEDRKTAKELLQDPWLNHVEE